MGRVFTLSSKRLNTALNSIIIVFVAVIIVFVFSALRQPAGNEAYLESITPEIASQTDMLPDLNLLEEKNKAKQVSVRLLNGCGVKGVAGKIREELVKEGIDVVQTANADHFQYEKTVVYLHTDSYSKTVYVSDALGIPNHPVMDDRKPDFKCDMTVVIGHDYNNLNPFNCK